MLFDDYGPALREHFEHPRRAGTFAGEDAADIAIGSAGSVAERALIRLALRIGGRDGDRGGPRIVDDVRFQAYGCGVTIACGSWTADWAVGKTLTTAAEFDHRLLVEALSLPALKIRPAVIAEQALRAAVEAFGR